MNGKYFGPERRQAAHDELIRTAVREAVSEALRSANLIDGPTHVAHHQMLEEQIALVRHAKKGILSAIVTGLCALLAWGLWAWAHGSGKP